MDRGSDVVIGAEVAGTVGSVRFGLDGNATHRVESSAPFSLQGDIGGDYAPWNPGPGVHTVTATAFTGADASGEAGEVVVVSFTVP